MTMKLILTNDSKDAVNDKNIRNFMSTKVRRKETEIRTSNHVLGILCFRLACIENGIETVSFEYEGNEVTQDITTPMEWGHSYFVDSIFSHYKGESLTPLSCKKTLILDEMIAPLSDIEVNEKVIEFLSGNEAELTLPQPDTAFACVDLFGKNNLIDLSKLTIKYNEYKMNIKKGFSWTSYPINRTDNLVEEFVEKKDKLNAERSMAAFNNPYGKQKGQR